ncbi:MAG: NUDIX domain-containing protein [Aeriscardovia sp.]|nr:NUDIX domain-containing protein [Aeriscardovia sp.]
MASLRTRAAGVVLEENGQIAMVHRGFYGDWSLPKGQIEEGEGVARCAVREAQEETGESLRLLGFLASSSYPTKFGQKTVFYFRGEKISGPLASGAQKALGLKRWKDSETEDVRKAPLEKAAGLLTYPDDRHLALALPPSPQSAIFWADFSLVPPEDRMLFSRTLACFAPERVLFSPGALPLAAFYSRLASVPLSPVARGPRGARRFAVLSLPEEFDLKGLGILRPGPGIYCAQIGNGAPASLVPFFPYPALPQIL